MITGYFQNQFDRDRWGRWYYSFQQTNKIIFKRKTLHLRMDGWMDERQSEKR